MAIRTTQRRNHLIPINLFLVVDSDCSVRKHMEWCFSAKQKSIGNYVKSRNCQDNSHHNFQKAIKMIYWLSTPNSKYSRRSIILWYNFPRHRLSMDLPTWHKEVFTSLNGKSTFHKTNSFPFSSAVVFYMYIFHHMRTACAWVRL